MLCYELLILCYEYELALLPVVRAIARRECRELRPVPRVIACLSGQG